MPKVYLLHFRNFTPLSMIIFFTILAISMMTLWRYQPSLNPDELVEDSSNSLVSSEAALDKTRQLTKINDIVSVLTSAKVDSWQNTLNKRMALLENLGSGEVTVSERSGNLIQLKTGFNGISELTYREGDDWQEILDVIGSLVPFVGSETVRLIVKPDIGSTSTHKLHEFQQIINGVEVRSGRLRIKTDNETGKVLNVVSTMISDRSLPTLPLFSATEAIKFASYHARESGIPYAVESSVPRLFYARSVLIENNVELVWEFNFGSKTARVNAIDGSVFFIEWSNSISD